ncbi:S-layer homology domain-containing protein [Paenibacillus radicis (ex Xue et al. 2023)]|uniref:S-layer homology domain-containing protein n=1 Tax=Paenibacillus radicis (ex Xue et al. 2023) TaxID=2972489 RepID=A0ABT1YTF2_9BACL|nr:S-layer homology domain-containing protein [Paenibacillus radicis (ex Xue et al. 2023)]MCR8636459.1 S-layer homology domain-containing protein [Paenibacillus radicis (ex Xue et al. 2023)]
MKSIRKRIAQTITFFILFTMIIPLLYSIPVVHADSVNLAKAISGKSSECAGCTPTSPATNVIDGDANTYWQTTNGDVTDDHNVWIEIDLGSSGNTRFDKVVLKGLNTSFITAYRVVARQNGSTVGTGTEVFKKLSGLSSTESVTFASTDARYVKIDLTVVGTASAKANVLSEVEIYNTSATPPTDPSVLDNVYFTGYASNDVLTLTAGQTASLQLYGKLTNGQPASLTVSGITYSSSNLAVATVNGSGQVQAIASGTATITGSATLNSVTKTVNLQVNVTQQQSGTVLSAVYLYDASVNPYPNNGTLKLSPGGSHQLTVRGVTDNQAAADLSDAAITYSSGYPEVIQVDQNGRITAVGSGTTYINVSVLKGGVTKSTRIWVDAYPPGTDMSTVNMALKKPVAASSFCGSTCGGSSGTYDYRAVDGDSSTYWRALTADFNDDKQHQLIIDFGRPTEFNKTVMNLNSGDTGAVNNYELYYSNDEKNWSQTFGKDNLGKDILWSNSQKNWQSLYQNRILIAKSDTAIFEPVTARYLLVNVFATKAASPLIYEVEVYRTNEAPVPPLSNALTSVYLYDQTVANYPEKAEINVPKGSAAQLSIGGKMFDKTNLNPSEAKISFTSSLPEVASIEQDGTIKALAGGVSLLTGTVTYGPITKSASLFLIVQDDTPRIADTGLTHPSIQTKIGTPAFIPPGSKYPDLTVKAFVGAELTGQVRRDGHETIHQFDAVKLGSGTDTVLKIPGSAAPGQYEVELQLKLENGSVVFDKLYFTVADVNQIPDDQSQIAYLGTEGKMVYVPDYRGNRILDFSNVGYMGGGVKLPDVQARVAVEPGDGDDTARIQAAIDYVSGLPIQEDGFRGAVLLKKGRYDIGGELYIRKSGVVLRGLGEGKEDTVLYATGTTRRYILNIGDTSASPVLLGDTLTKITDLYVPSGNHTFHVQDGSGYKTGDKIMIRRYGNSSWIHEIHMDQILPSTTETTVQWEPFSLEFDRVVTKVNGNEITIDAPIPNAIELQWGGGDIRKYDDKGRIERVGVENLRVDVEFDPKVTDVLNGTTYYSDENKAHTFARFGYIQNGWLRNVSGYHLETSLVFTGRSSKWITIQDAKVYDMVSIITGSRRYAFFYTGQLALTQRVYTETARHSFIVNSQVTGPNVFTDSDSVNSFARSEPHHRWSVGGLFDNIRGNANIIDRANYGTGHGWAGANYVVWNQTGELAVQAPPTAQNYAIGLVGKRYQGDYGNFPADGTFPAGKDPTRERAQGYWEQEGRHVQPLSLYTQQLQERLGRQAVQNIATTPVGGGALDIPQAPSSDKDMTSFSFQGLPASSNGVISGTTIAVRVPNPTALTNLVAMFTTTGKNVSVGSIAQVSGVTVNDFSNPVNYVVTAADGSTKSYNVVVTRDPGRQSSHSGQSGQVGQSEQPEQSPADNNGAKQDGTQVTPALDPQTNVAKTAVSSETLSSSFEKIKPDADGIKTLTINVVKIEGSKGYEIALPASFLSSNDTTKKLELKTEFASIILSTTMLKAADAQRSATASLLITKANTAQLPAELQKTLAGKPILDLALKLGGSLSEWKSADSFVEVSVPYTPSSNSADPEHVVVWYVDPAGRTQTVPSGKYDSGQNVVKFKINHFSLYAVTEVYKTFADLSSPSYSWAKKAIEVLASKAIVEGTQDDAYSPGAQVSRADFILLLNRTLGLTAANPAVFHDVSKDDYFYEAVGTAKALGIVDGVEDNLFRPHDTISRQDMMVILDRALALVKAAGEKAASAELSSYKDSSSVSSYAIKSVSSLLKKGLIEGDSSYLYPQNKVTRAEAAVVIYRLYNQK